MHPNRAGDLKIATRWSAALAGHVVNVSDGHGGGRPPRILPLGDSITECGYRFDLWRQLRAAAPRQPFEFVGTRQGLPVCGGHGRDCPVAQSPFC